MMTLVDSSALTRSPALLRKRFREDGYVFLPGLLPEEAVESVADAVSGCLRERGWLSHPAPARHVEDEDYWLTYTAVQQLEEFHRFAHLQAFTQVRTALMGERSFVLPLKVLRMIRPYKEQKEKIVHRDFDAFGIPGMLTVWVPLVDCPQELGALRLRPGSHEEAGDGSWASTDYRAGDAIVFDSRTLHSGQPNRTSGRIRLSADFRWQATTTPTPDWVRLPHQAEHLPGWEELARGWSSRAWIEVPPEVTRTTGDGHVFHR